LINSTSTWSASSSRSEGTIARNRCLAVITCNTIIVIFFRLHNINASCIIMDDSGSSMSVFFNFPLMIAVGVPPVLLGYTVINNCHDLQGISLDLCNIGLQQPLIFVNIVFFLCICINFWLISLLQGSTWLIGKETHLRTWIDTCSSRHPHTLRLLVDPYWTLIPPMIAVFYHFHPSADGDINRRIIAMVLTFVWAIRLTHSYLRREKYHFGMREDWRFTDMKKSDPKNWWWVSLVSFLITH
jgi:hypothetical protein